MASTRIRGITIELGADTSGLSKALKNVNGDLRTTQAQLRDVERLLKMDPSNTELLAQKQKLLAKNVEQTKAKVAELQKAEQALLDAGVDENSAQFMALKREIINTSAQLDKAEKEARDFSSALDDAGIKASTVAEKTKGVALASGAALAGVVAMGKKVVDAYADYEQLVGGVETLFKDAAKEVQDFANEAYKTAGLSANQYMETVTGFSASLVSSLGGDTQRAAQLADQAIIDMSDNANKMGTDMQMIQNAYQGFAKQNYTMLDNLKLGFGGTKQEMERLLQQASELAGVHFDISSYADIIEAIHVVQSEMGITGTTAKEAETTVTGSINAFKAAWENLVIGMGSSTADIDQLTQNVVDSFSTMAGNILGVVQSIWSNLPTAAQLGILAAGVMVIVNAVANLIAKLEILMPILQGLSLKTAGLIGALTLLVGLGLAIASAWDDMSGLEKVASVLGAVTAAALAAAMALGIFNSAATMGLAAAGIVAGIGLVIASIKSAESSMSKLPMMATGGTISNGSAIVGEAGAELLTVSNGAATVTPLTNNNTTVNNYGGGSSQPINLTLEIDGKAFAKATYSDMQNEGSRHGGRMVVK